MLAHETGKKYEDIIFQSMKTMVSLNDLVTTLSIQVAHLRTSLSEMKEDMEKIAEANAKQASALDEGEQRIASLETSVEKTRAKVEKMDEKVIVVSGEDDPGHQKCVKVCAGTTGRDSTDWKEYNPLNGVHLEVDISECGFIKTPTVTTSIEGVGAHFRTTGTSSVYKTQPTKFKMYLENNAHNPRGGKAEQWKWNVEWIAVGYTC